MYLLGWRLIEYLKKFSESALGGAMHLTWLRQAHGVCEEHDDIATTSLIEVNIEETERRTWFVFEASPPQDTSGH